MNRRSAALLIALLTTASFVTLAGPALALESPWDSQRLFPVRDVLFSTVNFDLELELDLERCILEPELELEHFPNLMV